MLRSAEIHTTVASLFDWFLWNGSLLSHVAFASLERGV